MKGNTLQDIEEAALGLAILNGYTQPVRTVGQNLAKILETLGISQVDFADRLNQRQPSVWKLLNTKGLPKLGTLFKIAKAVPVEISELIQGVDEDYDKIAGRDLLRHGRTRQLGSHQGEGANVPAAAHMDSDQRKRDKAAAKEIRAVINRLTGIEAALMEARAPAKRAASHRGRDRKTG